MIKLISVISSYLSAFTITNNNKGVEERLSPNINHHLSIDVKVCVNEDNDSVSNTPDDDSVSNSQDENNAVGLEEEITFGKNENGSPAVSTPSLPKNRKVCFYVTYCNFVTLYVVCFFLIAYTYPLKPTCHIDDFHLHAIDKDLSDTTEETKESVNLLLGINNRNRLIGASYDHFNITIYYLPTRNTSIYFASTIAPGFNQHKVLEQTKVIEVQMPAPGLRGLMQLQRPLSEIPFRVSLEFTVRFGCRARCKHKQHFIQLSTSRFHLKDGTIEDIVMMN